MLLTVPVVFQSYLSSGYPIAKDVRIENGRIVGARFMLQALDIVTTAQEKDFVVDIREIVDKYPFKVAVFNPIFVFVDQVITYYISVPICQNTSLSRLVKNELRAFSGTFGPPPSSA